ncbi:hypothetical protein BDA96_08G073500 [Sorghum bicolor]|uniref:Uncharacterized protein n=1 Tax=Sorghum bicolor TaxID=4558 RepID=A0A921QGB9_SORBI|nr:hypothetical protein BDA96_08G073500 [Sorghum bicolor]
MSAGWAGVWRDTSKSTGLLLVQSKSKSTGCALSALSTTPEAAGRQASSEMSRSGKRLRRWWDEEDESDDDDLFIIAGLLEGSRRNKRKKKFRGSLPGRRKVLRDISGGHDRNS